MTRNVFITSATFVLVASLAGCGIQTGKPLLTYERNSTTLPPMSTVKQDGTYALYPGNGLNPLDSSPLKKGDQYGFDTSDGKTVGVYVQNHARTTIPLSGVLTSEYVWKYQGNK